MTEMRARYAPAPAKPVILPWAILFCAVVGWCAMLARLPASKARFNEPGYELVCYGVHDCGRVGMASVRDFSTYRSAKLFSEHFGLSRWRLYYSFTGADFYRDRPWFVNDPSL